MVDPPRRVNRAPLTREAIVTAALVAADEGGIAALTMRGIAGRLGVEAMSLYHHVADKQALLAAAAERVWQDVDADIGTVRSGEEGNHAPRATTLGWADGIRLVAGRAHKALLAHAWVLEVASSAGGEWRMRVIEAILRELTRAGLTEADVYEGYHLIDALILGYTAQEASYRGLGEGAGAGPVPADLPYVADHARAHGQPRPEDSGFRSGLDLVLDGLARRIPR